MSADQLFKMVLNSGSQIWKEQDSQDQEDHEE